jgi:L-ribulose-5-phosphate 3-epimerase UlaE
MFSGREAAMTANENHEENLIRIWEKAVDTQMHFNEMSVKSRQLGFTFIAAALGIATN